jgi:hypothetical protein
MTDRITSFILVLMLVGGCTREPRDPGPDGGAVPSSTASSSAPQEQPPSAQLSPVEPQKPTSDAASPSLAPVGAVQEQAAAEIQAMGGEVMRNYTPGLHRRPAQKRR